MLARIPEQSSKKQDLKPVKSVDYDRLFLEYKASYMAFMNIKIPGFEVDEQNERQIDALVMYFAKHPDFLELDFIEKPSFEKGLMLLGGLGTGKTWSLWAFRSIGQFPIIPCHEIPMEVQKDDIPVLVKYGKKSYKMKEGLIRDIKRPLTKAFDDLGAEISNGFKSYGTDINVMRSILLARYEGFCQHGMITHLTTNFDANRIREVYGDDIRSRFREMFNQILFEGEERR